MAGHELYTMHMCDFFRDRAWQFLGTLWDSGGQLLPTSRWRKMCQALPTGRVTRWRSPFSDNALPALRKLVLRQSIRLKLASWHPLRLGASGISVCVYIYIHIHGPSNVVSFLGILTQHQS